jgi:hypothetical protein
VIFGSDETRRPRIFRLDVPNERVWLPLVKERRSEIKGQSGDQVKIITSNYGSIRVTWHYIGMVQFLALQRDGIKNA